MNQTAEPYRTIYTNNAFGFWTNESFNVFKDIKGWYVIKMFNKDIWEGNCVRNCLLQFVVVYLSGRKESCYWKSDKSVKYAYTYGDQIVSHHPHRVGRMGIDWMASKITGSHPLRFFLLGCDEKQCLHEKNKESGSFESRYCCWVPKSQWRSSIIKESVLFGHHTSWTVHRIRWQGIRKISIYLEIVICTFNSFMRKMFVAMKQTLFFIVADPYQNFPSKFGENWRSLANFIKFESVQDKNETPCISYMLSDLIIIIISHISNTWKWFTDKRKLGANAQRMISSSSFTSKFSPFSSPCFASRISSTNKILRESRTSHVRCQLSIC